ncbi:hypothetical protein B0H63DRAFT_533600 [Podospora didyma]|uniref:DUF3492 domain-containing protein n=1 Tax=Podospora didyma TaxID=330526 RepID=A0AAE0P814_9PEZI|nr:hypothetical protein B0H63DRAFT_533600 [Podospora didyma]
MASFLQPPTSGDPVIVACNNSNTTSHHWQVYCNRLLAPEERLKTPLQYFTLVFAVTCLVLPVGFSFITSAYRFIGRITRDKHLPPCSNKHTPHSSSPIDCKAINSAHSFRFLDEDASAPSILDDLSDQTLYITPLPSLAHAELDHISISACARPPGRVFGLLETNHLTRTTSAALINILSNLVHNNDILGVVVRDDGFQEDIGEPYPLLELLWQLHEREVPVLLNFNHDDDGLSDHVNFGLLAGIIINNACVLRTGERRDYFQSKRLREVMTKCVAERAQRAAFFVGFHDVWDTLPSAAVVCRAEKLARHFEAVFEHGPSKDKIPDMEPRYRSAMSRSTSGFEFLRKPETCDLQTAWLQERRKVHVGPYTKTQEGEIACLDLDELRSVFPDIESLLDPLPLSGDFEALRTETKPDISPPQYVNRAPPRVDFWEVTAHGEQISMAGCVPLCSTATAVQYQAISECQTHLRDLNMLHRFDEAENNKLLEQLRQFQSTSHQQYLIGSLIDGLVQQKVVVYKGLGTGFTLPDNAAEVWGVSTATYAETGGFIDIFISRRCQSDVGTILHTWMAHHGVARVQRFEEELRLEKVTDPAAHNALPASIRTAIDRATPTETLSLLQQLQVAQFEHPFKDAIMHYCKTVLLDETSLASWNDAHCRQYLDGSVTMRDLLERRLMDFIHMGATNLPLLERLVSMSNDVETLINRSLFNGDSDAINTITNALLHAFDPLIAWNDCMFVDVNSNLVALMFFCSLRKAALEDVYFEATDHCPLFSQLDQAAVFSELWVLGSQCELYFGMKPRSLGKIVYEKHRAFLIAHPPPELSSQKTGLMTVYAKPEPSTGSSEMDPDGPSRQGFKVYNAIQRLREKTHEFGALSIFCLPAILDLLLLTFLGRGMFMTAFMGDEYLSAACYGLLLSLLLSAGVTGWVGSVGNYYLCNYAYNSMIYFHVQRLSGGFALSLVVGIVGGVVFGLKVSVGSALTFFAYLLLISTYLYLLGIMATMHQQGSPLRSGRTVLWRTIPVLFLSPIISTFINGHDLKIYLSVGYGFLITILAQYRYLCHEWINWTDNIPKFNDKDIVEWYSLRLDRQQLSDDSTAESITGVSKESPEVFKRLALQAFRQSVDSRQKGLFNLRGRILVPDPLVRRIESGLPYIDWLFKKEAEGSGPTELFSVSWFAQLSQALKKQEQMAQGLKEHSILMLFRYARFDIGQNIGLFIICLMDRWVNITMAATFPSPSVFSHFTSRYAICLSILYFCGSVMTLDNTLRNYWTVSYELSDEKLSSCEEALLVAEKWERNRRRQYVSAFLKLGRHLMFIAGSATIFVWVLVDSALMQQLYYAYILGYSAVIIFQFNRCFTTNVRFHVASIFISAAVGFVTGCVLHAASENGALFFADVIALDAAAIIGAILTSIWAFNDFKVAKNTASNSNPDIPRVWKQFKLTARSASLTHSDARLESLQGNLLEGDATSFSQGISELLQLSHDQPSEHAATAPWAVRVLQTTLSLWMDNRIRVSTMSRSEFLEAGLEDLVSFATYENEILHVTVGLLGEDELGSLLWQEVSIRIATECILFHMSRTILGLNLNQATQAEFILHATGELSANLELQIATQDVAELSSIQGETNQKLLQHLCFGLDVDLEWDHLPLAPRAAILQRVIGEPISMSGDLCRWFKRRSVDLQAGDFHVNLCLLIHGKAEERLNTSDTEVSPAHFQRPISARALARTGTCGDTSGLIAFVRRRLFKVPVISSKWVAIISGGGANIERELWYSLRHCRQIRGISLWLLLLVLQLCWHMKNAWIYAMLVYRHNALVNISRLAKKGTSRTLHKNRIVVEFRRRTLTGFATDTEQGALGLEIFDGHLDERPTGTDSRHNPIAMAVYDDRFRLISRVEDKKECQVKMTYTYTENSKSRLPSSKQILNSDGEIKETCFYDKKGRVTHGTAKFAATEYSYNYFYKSNPKGSQEVLKAEFQLANVASSSSLTVFWGTPLREDLSEKCNWVPSDRVCRVVRMQGVKRYTTTSDYQHRRDPVMMTVMEEAGSRVVVPGPPRLFEHEESLQIRPSDVSFEIDDLFLHHRVDHIKRIERMGKGKKSWSSLFNPLAWQHWQRKVVYRPLPTWWLRTELWNHWRNSGTLDAIAACWMDELILREEPLLRGYWRARSAGQLSKAIAVLDSQIEQIVSAIEIEKDVSEVCLLPIKSSDLYTMGLGRDGNQLTTRPRDCFKDTTDRISVIFNDIGCWPDAPGGVSNCRRDLVNGHNTIRNHVLAETANEYGIPRFQVEKSVQSLKMLPLWGLDNRTPNHGVIDNLLETQVDDKISNTDPGKDIESTFVPLLRLFVKGARSRHISRQDMIKYSDAMLAMFAYFERKDYNETWNSREVLSAWADAWLTRHDDPDIVDPGDYFEIEKPSMSDFRGALSIYSSYFFIFSVQTPEDCPKVFQSTHHGISSLFGMLLKYRRGATFGIWDHAILWRECCLNISPAQSALPLPVQSMLLAGIGLAMKLAYFHADVVLPCTPVFNPIWEAELGTDSNRLGHRKGFTRKIDPIVNGVSNMDAFKPVDEVRTETPTVVMLSNVQFIKDIKTAILAADVIVNKFGFSDYRLFVYGARDREPSYDIDMTKLIESCNLTDRVVLKGFGKPHEALKDAWLFMNSSLSEGLPLAIAEAALAGVPIVATAVGATALVLTNPENPSVRYGEVVPPNDPMALARAQIAMLAMAGPWAKFAGDVDKRGSVLPHLLMPDTLTEQDVKWLSKRMLEKTEARRQLGMLGREMVLRGFHGKRYLREHEQMYWIQWHLAYMRMNPDLQPYIPPGEVRRRDLVQNNARASLTEFV